MPYMLDLAYHNDPDIYQHKPRVSNHLKRGGSTQAEGLNVLFYDNHVEWHKLGPQSWRIGTDFYEGY